MKTLQAAIISCVAIALSGCATGYYQRGYAGYNTGYTVQRHYDRYDRDYYRPGTGFGYEQTYVQPHFAHERREHEHQGWQPAPQFNHYDGGHGGWQGREERERPQRGFEGNRGEGGRQHRDWRGERGE